MATSSSSAASPINSVQGSDAAAEITISSPTLPHNSTKATSTVSHSASENEDRNTSNGHSPTRSHSQNQNRRGSVQGPMVAAQGASPHSHPGRPAINADAMALAQMQAQAQALAAAVGCEEI